MQVVEYVEESILGALAQEVLDVVHYEDVDSLIESDEVHDAVAFHGIHILRLEFVSGDIQHLQVLETLFDVNADGLGDMRFAQTGAAEEEERIERGFPRSHRDALSCADA